MKPEKSVVYVSSRNKKSVKVIENSIVDHPVNVLSCAKRPRRVSKDVGIKVILLDRSLRAAELEEFANLGNDWPVATFGASNSSADVLGGIESKADYQLRHPVSSRDIGRLFDHLQEPSGAENTLPASRSAVLLSVRSTTLTEKVKRLDLSDRVKTAGEAR